MSGLSASGRLVYLSSSPVFYSISMLLEQLAVSSDDLVKYSRPHKRHKFLWPVPLLEVQGRAPCPRVCVIAPQASISLLWQIANAAPCRAVPARSRPAPVTLPHGSSHSGNNFTVESHFGFVKHKQSSINAETGHEDI